ncbi:hypothetical protein LTR86_006651 [Recurvomyces mirabilis]|nr:hypothetical protein LTR86_006651 [Recurvomyces mirabilis]
MCCLPCPISDWVFSDSFNTQAPAANYISIAAFILNSMLLITFIVLPETKSHRHYLSIGLTISLMLLSIAFIIPLSKEPEFCYDAITPNNMHSDLSCAWSGALLLAGAMGTAVWVLLRSVWTALRIVFDFKHLEIYKWVSIPLGVGLPLLFLGLTLPLTGVSYRLYNVCIPNGPHAFATWFLWILIFAGAGGVVLVLTVLWCLWKYALSAFAGKAQVSGYTGGGTSQTTTQIGDQPGTPKSPGKASKRGTRVEWSRIQRVVALQWRTILLAFIVVNETIYFGLVFVEQTAAIEASSHGITAADLAWGVCLIETLGDKVACLPQSGGLGVSEARIVATLILASLLGPVVFFLMVRWSMLEGWWEIIRNPLGYFKKRRGSMSSQDFIMATSPRHISLNKPLGSDTPELKSVPRSPMRPKTVPEEEARGLDGAVAAGHEHEYDSKTDDAHDGLDFGLRDHDKHDEKDMSEDEVLV